MVGGCGPGDFGHASGGGDDGGGDESGDDVGDAGETDGGPEPTPPGETATTPGACESRGKIDVLFVVDDSLSMAQFQATTVAQLRQLTGLLGHEDIPADYRFAFTSSSVSGPGCVSADDGRLLLDTCRA